MLAEKILSIPTLGGDIADRLGYGPLARVINLYEYFRPQAQSTININWIWKIGPHPRVILFM